MLHIRKLTDYAMLIMGQMAKESHSILSASCLAEKLYLSTPTVSKILKILSDAALVRSIRGAEGGYRLAREAQTISVADVITAMEGDLPTVESCEEDHLCSLDASCTLRENWQHINERVKGLLSNLTLVDMLSPLTSKGVSHDK